MFLVACAPAETEPVMEETGTPDEIIVEDTPADIPEDDMNGMDEHDDAEQMEMPEQEYDESILTGETVTFELTGENFAFFMNGEEAPELRVNYGDVVRIEFTSTSGTHDWVVDEFSAATEIVTAADGMTYVEFVADEVGTFEYYCSVGQHRANGMVGNLVVE